MSLAHAVLLHKQGGSNRCNDLANKLEEAAQAVKLAYSQCPSYDKLVPALLEHPVEVRHRPLAPITQAVLLRKPQVPGAARRQPTLVTCRAPGIRDPRQMLQAISAGQSSGCSILCAAHSKGPTCK